MIAPGKDTLQGHPLPYDFFRDLFTEYFWTRKNVIGNQVIACGLALESAGRLVCGPFPQLVARTREFCK